VLAISAREIALKNCKSQEFANKSKFLLDGRACSSPLPGENALFDEKIAN